MFNIFKSKTPRLRTDGFYYTNWNDLTFFLFFNKFQLVSYADNSEYKDEQVNIDPIAFREGLREFADVASFEAFEEISRFSIVNDGIEFTFFQPEDFESLQNGVVNEDYYVKWQGRIVDDGLVLSRIDSYLNYSLQRYDSRTTIHNLKFLFAPVQF